MWEKSSAFEALDAFHYNINVTDEEVEELRKQQHDHFMAHDE